MAKVGLMISCSEEEEYLGFESGGYIGAPQGTQVKSSSRLFRFSSRHTGEVHKGGWSLARDSRIRLWLTFPGSATHGIGAATSMVLIVVDSS